MEKWLDKYTLTVSCSSSDGSGCPIHCPQGLSRVIEAYNWKRKNERGTNETYNVAFLENNYTFKCTEL